jgi:multiple antibiotic resistance protein
MSSFVEILLGTLAALIPIVNPFSTSSIFLSLTFLDSDHWRSKQALKGVFYMFLILVSFLLFGSFIINFFGISLPGMRIAGGILLSRMAFNMLYTDEDLDSEDIKKHRLKKDIAFFPLAIPSLAGPGSIALVISIGTFATGKLDYLAIISGILLLSVVTYLTLRSATYFKKYFGEAGLKVMTKIMGFIIFCIGVQFVITGVTDLRLFGV